MIGCASMSAPITESRPKTSCVVERNAVTCAAACVHPMVLQLGACVSIYMATAGDRHMFPLCLPQSLRSFQGLVLKGL